MNVCTALYPSVAPTDPTYVALFGQYLQCLSIRCENIDPSLLSNADLCALAPACGLVPSQINAAFAAFDAATGTINPLCPSKCGICYATKSSIVSDLTCSTTALRSDDPTAWGWTGFIGFLVLGLGLAFWLHKSDFALSRPINSDEPLYHKRKFVLIFVSLAVCATCALIAMAQGLISFDIRYTIGSDPAKYTFKHHFWSAIERFWENEAFMLTVFLAITGGVWPFVKQLLVMLFATLGGRKPWLQRDLAFTGIQFLGLTGKGAFMDISFMCMAISIMDLDLVLMVLGQSRQVKVGITPRQGIAMLLLGIMLSRMVTSTLMHLLTPDGKWWPNLLSKKVGQEVSSSEHSTKTAPENESGGSQQSRSKLLDGFIWVLSGVGLVLTVMAVFCGLNMLEQKSSFNVRTRVYNPVSESITDYGTTENVGEMGSKWTFLDLITRCGEAELSEASSQTFRSFLVAMVVFLCAVLSLVQSLATVGTMALLHKGEHVSAGLKNRLRHIVLLSMEWATLDVTLLGLLIMHKELGTNMSNTEFEYCPSAGTKVDVNLNVDLSLMSGYWVGLAGCVLSDLGALLLITTKQELRNLTKEE